MLQTSTLQPRLLSSFACIFSGISVFRIVSLLIILIENACCFILRSNGDMLWIRVYPLSITVSFWAISAISLVSCVLMITEQCWFYCKLVMLCQILLFITGSTPAVTSSNISTRGLPAMALHKPSLLSIPPDRFLANLFLTLCSSICFRILIASCFKFLLDLIFAP